MAWIMNKQLLDDRVALVTGASGGIGGAIARGLSIYGMTLCLIGRSQTALELVAEQCRARGAQAVCFTADFSVDEQVHRLIEQIRSSFVAVDILVHSAGEYSFGRVESAPVEDFDRLYRVNVRTPYLLTQGLLPALVARHGQVVFINSSAGLGGRATVSQYAATKHALKGFTDSLRAEVNPQGVRVLSIYPGRTASHMQEMIYAQEGRVYQSEKLLQPEDVSESVIGALMLPRTAEVTDIHIRPANKC